MRRRVIWRIQCGPRLGVECRQTGLLERSRVSIVAVGTSRWGVASDLLSQGGRDWFEFRRLRWFYCWLGLGGLHLSSSCFFGFQPATWCFEIGHEGLKGPCCSSELCPTLACSKRAFRTSRVYRSTTQVALTACNSSLFGWFDSKMHRISISNNRSPLEFWMRMPASFETWGVLEPQGRALGCCFSFEILKEHWLRLDWLLCKYSYLFVLPEPQIS